MSTCSKLNEAQSGLPSIKQYEESLRRLASELALSEERQRREIAEDLHDHLGQGLAMLRMKLMKLRGNAVFCGLDGNIDEMDKLLGKIIRYTRSLTFEISPPVLYELGLGPALEWLAEEYSSRHGLSIGVELNELPEELPSPMRVMLFKSMRELLINVIKHAEAGKVLLSARIADQGLALSIQDDGLGFDDPEAALHPSDGAFQGFGLFSISERLKLCNGALTICAVKPKGSVVTMTLPDAAWRS